MKIQLLIIFLLLNSTICISDTLDIRTFDYTKADSIALNFKKKYKSTEKLSKALTANLNTEHEKYRVIFRWVTNNISYNIENKNIDCRYTLKTGSALCSGYSKLIFELCQNANIDCKMVNGYAKSKPKHIGKFKKTNHAWNLVLLNGTWYISDATWAAGYVNRRTFIKDFDSFYFLAKPEQIIYNHYPAQKDWFLTNETFNLKDFEKMPIFHSEYFNLGVKTNKTLNGLIENQLKFKFKTDYDIYQATIKFDKEKETRPIQLDKDKNGYYTVDMEFDRHLHGPCWFFINGKSVLIFMKE